MACLKKGMASWVAKVPLAYMRTLTDEGAGDLQEELRPSRHALPFNPLSFLYVVEIADEAEGDEDAR